MSCCRLRCCWACRPAGYIVARQDSRPRPHRAAGRAGAAEPRTRRALDPRSAGGRRAAHRAGRVRSRVAEVWHVAVIVYLVGIYLVWAFNISDGFFYLLRATIITALVIGAVAASERWLPRLFNRFSGVDAALVARYPVVAARANRYVPIFRASSWVRGAYRRRAGRSSPPGASMSAAFCSAQMGREFLGRATDIVIVLVLALAAWEILGGIIYAKLNQRDESGLSPCCARRGRARCCR